MELHRPPVVLANGAEAVCHMVDVRHSLGVLIGMLCADSPIDVDMVATMQPHA